MIGKIIENISNLYKVEANGEIYEATARGKFKNENQTPVVGFYLLLQQRKLYPFVFPNIL